MVAAYALPSAKRRSVWRKRGRKPERANIFRYFTNCTFPLCWNFQPLWSLAMLHRRPNTVMTKGERRNKGDPMVFLLLESSASLALSAFLIVFLRRLAIPLHLIDLPDHRKIHEGAIPLCGGIAIFLSFAGITLLSGPLSLGLGFWVAMGLITILGVADDRFTLPARTRFLAQVLIALALITTEGLGRLSLGDLLPPEAIGGAAGLFILSATFIVGLVNAWNMMDGIDGLAGGSAVAALVWILLLVVHLNEEGLVFPVMALIAAIIGFLIFNARSPWRPKAAVYLGDAGSTTLGAIIAYLVLRLSGGTDDLPFPVLLWLVIIPVTDTLSLMVRRMLDHRSPMSADRRHLHHLLIDTGLSPAAASYTIIVVSFLCGGVGYLGLVAGVPASVMTIGLFFVAFAHTAFVLVVEASVRHRLHRIVRPSINLHP